MRLVDGILLADGKALSGKRMFKLTFKRLLPIKWYLTKI